MRSLGSLTEDKSIGWINALRLRITWKFWCWSISFPVPELRLLLRLLQPIGCKRRKKLSNYWVYGHGPIGFPNFWKIGNDRTKNFDVGRSHFRFRKLDCCCNCCKRLAIKYIKLLWNLFGPLHVLWFLAFGSWVTWFFSSWERKNCLQSWANSQNDNYFHSKRQPRAILCENSVIA